MHEIPHAVLSEQFQEHLKGRRLKSAVFLTFKFEPDFFEQEVLPAVMPDLPLSHVPAIRLLQLEDALKEVGDIAVYYDHAGLMPGGGSPRLDVRRIPVSHPTGYFHPKNIFLLTEAAEPDADGSRPEHLVVATLSANLTRRGWWENVEACHIEDVPGGDECSFRDELLSLLRRVRDAAPAGQKGDAIAAIEQFARKLRQARKARAGGALNPRIYDGKGEVVDFLAEHLGGRADGLCLEVISPYFDAGDCVPLRKLCERFEPREVRVYLPRDDDGSAKCDAAFYDAVSTITDARWAQLPTEMLKAGKQERIKRRTVHAKVYRFFDPHRRFEVLFTGSVNLTTAAHSKGGNFESGVLVETFPGRVPDWWLQSDAKRPPSFMEGDGEDKPAPSTALAIRFDWSTGAAAAYWDSSKAAGMLEVSANGAALFPISDLRRREWQQLDSKWAGVLAALLPSTSFLEVSEDGGLPAAILVQEEGMAHKPSILHTLSAADILRYWALLTPAQRAAFLEDKAASIPEALGQLGKEYKVLGEAPASMFDSFAGIYHGFHALEKFILAALAAGRTKEAEYRLLGKKYDSLPVLLERVVDSGGDAVGRYVTALCAEQLVRHVEVTEPDFVKQNRAQVRSLKKQVDKARAAKNELSFGSAEEREAFIEWFEKWFLARSPEMQAAS